jgi:hypothetical protein
VDSVSPHPKKLKRKLLATHSSTKTETKICKFFGRNKWKSIPNLDIGLHVSLLQTPGEK